MTDISRKKTTKRSKIKLWQIIMAVLGLMILLHAVELVERSMIESAPARSGTLEESVQVQGLVIASGERVLSPAAGVVHYLVKDGDRVPVGKLLAEVTAAGVNIGGGKTYSVRAPITGIVNLPSVTDDTISPLNTQVVSQMSLAKLLQLEDASPAASQDANGGIRQGQEIARIINNLQPAYLVVELPEGFSPQLKVDDELVLSIAAGERKGVVRRLEQDGQRRLAMLAVPADLISGNSRPMLVLQGREYAGQIVPLSALVDKGGQTGVYVAREGKLYWTQVEVVGQLEGQAAVEGLDENIQVVTNPGKIMATK